MLLERHQFFGAFVDLTIASFGRAFGTPEVAGKWRFQVLAFQQLAAAADDVVAAANDVGELFVEA